MTLLLAACQQASVPETAAPQAPAAPQAEPQATCGDSAIRLLDRSAGIHGAIVADTLHMGGAAAPATCSAPVNQSQSAIPGDRTAQAQQSQYYLIVIRYTSGNRLYVISRRGDGTSCVVDTNDQCVAQVTDLPDDFDLNDLPDDVASTIPAGRLLPTTAPAPAGNPQPRDGATGVAVETLLLSWSAAARAASYDVYWGATENLAADADLGTPIATTSTATTIRRPGATAAERRLALGTTYYWRVDAKNDQMTTTGSVWSFTTADQAAPPVAPGGGYTPPAETPPPAEETTDPEPLFIWIDDQSFSETLKRPYAQYTHDDDGNEVPYSSLAVVTVYLRYSRSESDPCCATAPGYLFFIPSTTDGTAKSESGPTRRSAGPWDFNGPVYFDWAPNIGIKTIKRGKKSVTIPIWIIDDSIEEEDETFTLNISVHKVSADEYGLSCGRCQATITIVDDD